MWRMRSTVEIIVDYDVIMIKMMNYDDGEREKFIHLMEYDILLENVGKNRSQQRLSKKPIWNQVEKTGS